MRSNCWISFKYFLRFFGEKKETRNIVYKGLFKKGSGEMKLTTEEIHNIYLHQGGVAEGLLRAGADADFPVMFAEAIIQFYEGKLEAQEK